jgi:hypothetical protein
MQRLQRVVNSLPICLEAALQVYVRWATPANDRFALTLTFTSSRAKSR